MSNGIVKTHKECADDGKVYFVTVDAKESCDKCKHLNRWYGASCELLNYFLPSAEGCVCAKYERKENRDD